MVKVEISWDKMLYNFQQGQIANTSFIALHQEDRFLVTYWFLALKNHINLDIFLFTSFNALRNLC